MYVIKLYGLGDDVSARCSFIAEQALFQLHARTHARTNAHLQV